MRLEWVTEAGEQRAGQALPIVNMTERREEARHGPAGGREGVSEEAG